MAEESFVARLLKTDPIRVRLEESDLIDMVKKVFDSLVDFSGGV